MGTQKSSCEHVCGARARWQLNVGYLCQCALQASSGYIRSTRALAAVGSALYDCMHHTHPVPRTPMLTPPPCPALPLTPQAHHHQDAGQSEDFHHCAADARGHAAHLQRHTVGGAVPAGGRCVLLARERQAKRVDRAKTPYYGRAAGRGSGGGNRSPRAYSTRMQVWHARGCLQEQSQRPHRHGFLASLC